MRFHVHTHVDNLQASIAFYSRMFGAQPVQGKPVGIAVRAGSSCC